MPGSAEHPAAERPIVGSFVDPKIIIILQGFRSCRDVYGPNLCSEWNPLSSTWAGFPYLASNPKGVVIGQWPCRQPQDYDSWRSRAGLGCADGAKHWTEVLLHALVRTREVEAHRIAVAAAPDLGIGVLAIIGSGHDSLSQPYHFAKWKPWVLNTKATSTFAYDEIFSLGVQVTVNSE
jgi:hypothetical protein